MGTRPTPCARSTRALVVTVVAAVGLLVAACGGTGTTGPDGADGADGAEQADRVEGSRTVGSGPSPVATSDDGLPLEAPFERVDDLTTLDSEIPDGLGSWRDRAPGTVATTVTSSADGAEQAVYWLPPDAPGRPLLVVLHSWSNDLSQGNSAPFAGWAAERGWAVVAPDFRGVNERPEATGSDLAVQDVVDAVDFAVEEGGVDPERVYAIGVSGGGMMSLLAGGSAPDRFGGLVAWVPVYDVTGFYAFTRDEFPERDYPEQIIASCGGDPTADQAAAAECESRSPLSVADGLRDADVPVYLGVGIDDDIVPPSQSVRAFNDLAAEEDRLPEEWLAAVDDGTVPDGATVDQELSRFGEAEPEILLTATSEDVTLVVFDGDHEMLYNPGLAWLTALAGDPVATGR